MCYDSVAFFQQVELMKSKEFTEICRTIWGYGFQTAAAKALDINRGTVVRYVRGVTKSGKIITIKEDVADNLRRIYYDKKN